MTTSESAPRSRVVVAVSGLLMLGVSAVSAAAGITGLFTGRLK